MHSRNSIALAISTLVALFAACPCWAQEARGRIQGLVSDSTGSAVPGASIDIENAATGASYRMESNQQGRYIAPFLNVGTYAIHAEKAGFKKFLRQGIEVQVNDSL